MAKSGYGMAYWNRMKDKLFDVIQNHPDLTFDECSILHPSYLGVLKKFYGGKLNDAKRDALGEKYALPEFEKPRKLEIDYIGNHVELEKLESRNYLPIFKDQQKSPESLVMENEKIKAVHEVLSTLPVEKQEILKLRYFEELPLKEASEKIGLLSPEGARRREKVALKEFRQLYKRYEEK